MNLIGYLRVSSDAQIDGYGLETQEQAINAWAARNTHSVCRVVVDAGVSGTVDAVVRPGLSEVLAAIAHKEVEGLVVARLDRLARALTVQEATLAIVWRSGGDVFTADTGRVMADDPDDPMRTALRQVVGVFAELDRRMVVKRLRDGRAIKAATGRKAVGSYPFGYRVGGQGRYRDAVVHPDEAVTVREIVHLRGEGASYRAIADRLNGRDVRAKNGGRWHPMTVRAVVLRESS
jgi:DNA invertase Pin-like site-specific DNA recombinase